MVMRSLVIRLLKRLLKIVTLETMDPEREERLSLILEVVKQISEKDWTLKRNERAVKDVIHCGASSDYGLVMDGMLLKFDDQSQKNNLSELVVVYETLPYVISCMNDVTWVRFVSSDDSIFCSGKIIGVINSDIINEKIVRGKTVKDTYLLNFFENLRLGWRTP